jgi:hypothetical protein
VTPDGTALTASLPEGIQGHFGSDLCRFILARCYQGQVTVPRFVEILQTLGVFISKREVMSKRWRALKVPPGSRRTTREPATKLRTASVPDRQQSFHLVRHPARLTISVLLGGTAPFKVSLRGDIRRIANRGMTRRNLRTAGAMPDIVSTRSKTQRRSRQALLLEERLLAPAISRAVPDEMLPAW